MLFGWNKTIRPMEAHSADLRRVVAQNLATALRDSLACFHEPSAELLEKFAKAEAEEAALKLKYDRDSKTDLSAYSDARDEWRAKHSDIIVNALEFYKEVCRLKTRLLGLATFVDKLAGLYANRITKVEEAYRWLCVADDLAYLAKFIESIYNYDGIDDLRKDLIKIPAPEDGVEAAARIFFPDKGVADASGEINKYIVKRCLREYIEETSTL